MSNLQTTPSRWVIGRYDDEKAKYVKGLANAGGGYIVLESPGKSVVVAFRQAAVDAVPDHLELVTDNYKIEKYEKIEQQRSGLPDQTNHRPPQT